MTLGYNCLLMKTARSATRQRSFRLPERTLEELAARARERGETANSLARRLIEEGLRTQRHPLIYFREGAAGRRPALVGTRLDVWQVIATLQAEGNDVSATAKYFEIPERSVQACLSYYAEFKDEVDVWAREQEEFGARAEEAWRRERQLLA